MILVKNVTSFKGCGLASPRGHQTENIAALYINIFYVLVLLGFFAVEFTVYCNSFFTVYCNCWFGDVQQ